MSKSVDPEALLRRAYALSSELKPNERALVLERLASQTPRMPANFTRGLAEDLAQLLPQLPASAQPQALNQSVSAMAAVDPDHAIAMLLAVDPPHPAADWQSGDSDPRAAAAQSLFDAVSQKRGPAAQAQLRQAALSLGERGFYPYRAVGIAIARVQNPDDAASWFNEAVEFYANQPQARWLDEDFYQFLRPLTWILPRPAVRKGYDALVQNLITAAESDTSPPDAEVRTDKGSVQLNAEEAQKLWQMTAILRVISPELEQHVAEARPNIARVQAITDGATWQQVNFLNRKPYVPTQEDLDEMPAARASDSESAKAALANSSGADRVRLLLAMAAGAKENTPARAAGLLQDATDAAAKLDNPRQQLSLLSNIVESAEDISQAAVVRSALQVAFPVGDQLLRKAIDDDPSLQHGLPASNQELQRLTTAGMYVDPDFTTSLINQLSTPLPKALLLITAADAQFANAANRKATRKVSPVKR